MAVVNLAGVQASTYLEEGESVCSVVKVEDKASKDKGTPMVVVTLRDRLGRSDMENFVLSDKALFRLKGFAIACGIPEERLNGKFNTDELRGKSVLVIKRLKGMRTIPTETGPKEVKDFERAFGPASGAPSAAAPASGAVGGGFTEDDVRF